MRLTVKKNWQWCLAILPVWLLLKLRFFNGLEYNSDIYSYLLLSRSSFEGHPLLYEPSMGSMYGIHNYFGMLLFYPVTELFGVPGFFLAHAALLAAAFISVGRWIEERAGASAIWIFAVLFFGPVAFWLWDDPVYGWHIELFFLPLALLFLTARLRGSRLSYLWAVLILVVREDGPIVLWGAWMASLVNESGPAAVRAACVATVSCAALFGVEMGVLRLSGAPSRVSVALQRMSAVLKEPRAAYLILHLSACWLFVLSPVIAVCAAAKRRKLVVIAALAAIAPLFFTSALAGFYYGPNYATMGLLWPPRFIMPWSCALAFAVVSLPELRWPRASGTLAGACLGLFAWQLCALSIPLGRQPRMWPYPVVSRLASALTGRLTVTRLSEVEQRALACLGRKLPRRSRVLFDDRLFYYFQRQDFPSLGRGEANEARPDAYVCDTAQRLSLPCDQIPKILQADKYARRKVDRLVIGTVEGEPNLAARECLAAPGAG